MNEACRLLQSNLCFSGFFIRKIFAHFQRLLYTIIYMYKSALFRVLKKSDFYLEFQRAKAVFLIAPPTTLKTVRKL